MTFGGGGHTKAILSMVPEVKVLALDRDPTAISLAEKLSKESSWVINSTLIFFLNWTKTQVKTSFSNCLHKSDALTFRYMFPGLDFQAGSLNPRNNV